MRLIEEAEIVIITIFLLFLEILLNYIYIKEKKCVIFVWSIGSVWFVRKGRKINGEKLKFLFFLQAKTVI